jgi:segregation and condensation protein B
MHEENASAENSNESPLSLSRLRQAFAAMLGEPGGDKEANSRSRVSPKLGDGCLGETALRGIQVNPRSVVEAILFVGRPDNRALSARELAAAMRGVSPGEVDAAVQELNSAYNADETPYHIEGTSAGYRLVLHDAFARMRDKFYGRTREAKLSPAAIEALSIIAYNQPVTAHEISALRGAANGAALATLVRRRLVRLDRPDAGAPPQYVTTERFLKLFGLESLDALPRSEELEKL